MFVFCSNELKVVSHYDCGKGLSSGSVQQDLQLFSESLFNVKRDRRALRVGAGSEPMNNFATWGWYLFRLLSITVSATATAAVASFYIADYVTNKSMSGFALAATNLQSSFNNLDGSVKKLDETLRSEVRL